MQLFNRYVSTRSLTVFAAELLLIFGSVALAAVLQQTDLAANLWKIALVTLICQLCLYYNDFYDLTVVHSSRELSHALANSRGTARLILKSALSRAAVVMYFQRSRGCTV